MFGAIVLMGMRMEKKRIPRKGVRKKSSKGDINYTLLISLPKPSCRIP